MLPVSRRAVTSPRILLRLASTSARPAAADADSALNSTSGMGGSPSSPSSLSSAVTWPEYLRLRQAQRRAGIIASVPTTALGAVIGGSYFGTIEVWPGYSTIENFCLICPMTLQADPSALIFGIEPVFIYVSLQACSVQTSAGSCLLCQGAATFATIGLGWLLGSPLGTFAWRLMHRSKATQLEAKEREFFQHIERNRGNPARMTVSNPIPWVC